MRRSLQKYLEDIQHSVTEIESFVSGKTFQNYEQNVEKRRAVERDFTIIGEAIYQMIRQFPEARQRIDDIRKIANFRHLLIHDYDEVDDRLVWDIAQRSAPLLKEQVTLWLSEINSTLP